MKFLKERKLTLNTQLSASTFLVFKKIIVLLGVMILALWIHIPFAPVPWNLSFFAAVVLSMAVPLPVALCVTSLWILMGCYASAWCLPYAASLHAPWGGYIWGMLCVTYCVCRLTEKKVRPVYVWISALCVLECASMFQYWRVSPSLAHAKHTGLFSILPWHIVQGLLGLSIGKTLQRGLYWILRQRSPVKEITLDTPKK